MAYELVKRLLPPGTYQEYKADLKLQLLEPDGSDHSTIQFKSGDNPDTLRGFAVNFFVLDEAARMPYESFVSVMTTVTQTRGRGIIISTPNGRGWFYDVYQRGEKFDQEGNSLLMPGEDDVYPEWRSIRMPTWMNPHVDPKSIIELKRNLPEDVFRQEIAAQFLLDSAGVFRNIKSCIRGILEPYQHGHSYVMGVDLARLRDFSVLTIMDRQRKHTVYWERFKDTQWEVQYHKIISAARQYRATAVIDSTGIGDPIVQTIQNAGVRVEPYKIGSNIAKKQLIDKLRVNIEQGRISYPPLPIMLRELENYEYEISTNGTFKFSAPSGQNDDCVISLALANWGADADPFIYRHFNVRGI